jgi:hypothetical protein
MSDDVDELVERTLRRFDRRLVPSRVNVRPTVEIASTGIDEFSQGTGTDAFGTLDAAGLRVPLQVGSTGGEVPHKTRYLFQLASLYLSGGRRVRLRGLRQSLLFGGLLPAVGSAPPVLVEFPVDNPYFRFADGNVSWHLMKVPPMNRNARQQTDSDNFIYRFAEACGMGALVYETAGFPAANLNSFGRPDFYQSLTSYLPPNGGRPYGRPLLPVLHEIRYPIEHPESDLTLDMVVEGPGSVVLYASVLQTIGGTTKTTTPTTVDFANFDEWAAFLSAINIGPFFSRVGGSIFYEDLT